MKIKNLCERLIKRERKEIRVQDKVPDGYQLREQSSMTY